MSSIELSGNRWLVTGEILVDNANAVLQESTALQIDQNLVIDLAAVSNLDTAALSLLLEWQRRAEVAGKKVEFVNLPESLVSLAALYGVTDLIPKVS